MMLVFSRCQRNCMLAVVMMGMFVAMTMTATQAVAASPKPQPDTVPLLAKASSQDITFDSPIWEDAAVFEGFVLSENSQDERSLQQSTTVKLFHDGKNFYILYTALDSQIDKLNAEPLDEFADTFPQGDHGELTLSNEYVFAFGPQGNRYDARRFDRTYDSAFIVKSRVNKSTADEAQAQRPTGWQSMVIIPLRGIVRSLGKRVPMQFVRHYDGGQDQPQRSYLAITRTEFALE